VVIFHPVLVWNWLPSAFLWDAEKNYTTLSQNDTLRQIIAQGIIQVPVFFRIIPGGF
jgi:hypothetical protein